MTDMQTQDQQVANAGTNQTGVTRTTQTVADPVTGASSSRSTTNAWSGRAPGIEFVWLVAGIVVALLALDFIFHAAGANDVGFASFIFSVGTFLASPFAGIFKTASPAHGSLVVWADVVAIVIYALIAAVIAKIVTMMMARSATSSR